MSDLNNINIIGRLTRDPETRTNDIANFSLAVNGYKKDDVSFFNCVTFGKLSGIVMQYCRKGKQVAISGRLKQDRYTDRDGENQSSIKIIVENLQLLGGDRQEQSQPAAQQAYLDDDYIF
jgi:single-strand DNA-binding protein